MFSRVLPRFLVPYRGSLTLRHKASRTSQDFFGLEVEGGSKSSDSGVQTATFPKNYQDSKFIDNISKISDFAPQELPLKPIDSRRSNRDSRSKNKNVGQQRLTVEDGKRSQARHNDNAYKRRIVHEKQKHYETVDLEDSTFKFAMSVREKLYKDKKVNLVGQFDPKEYDSQGNKILKNQVPHFENASEFDIISMLRQGILYDENDIVAISKPYGIGFDVAEGSYGIEHFLDKIIPQTTLIPMHRLDKDCTGVLLFAKTKEMKDKLREHFVIKRDVVKRYLAITKNYPQQLTGEIDMPIVESKVESRVRMTVRPYSTPDLYGVMKKRQPGMIAQTRYRVISVNDEADCAVLECVALTGKKHQIRVHLAFGLNCPILGDHKYAHMNKLAPMRLNPEMLRLLKISQSGARHLALHLHARSILIPKFLNERDLYITAPLPPHFRRNMADLKLKLPPHM